MDREKEETGTKKNDEPNYRGIKAMPFVIGNETFEKLGTIGTSSNLLVYLTTVFNIKSITATNLINVFNGTCNFGTLLGAFLSDTYLGRYKTLGIASVSSFLGMLVLALTAAIPMLHPHDNSRPSPWQLTFLLCGFVFLVVGSSGIRPCNLAFGADQFNPNTESGRGGINSFFNWYYFTFTFAMMVSLTFIVYVQSNVNWALGFAIPTFFMFLSCVFFFVGTKMYVKILPSEGSPLTSIVQVIVAAIKKRNLKLPEMPSNSLLFNHTSTKTINSKLPYTNQFRFLNKAAIVTPDDDNVKTDGSACSPWRICSVQQVEEVKCVLRVFPIWISGLLYYIVQIQMNTYVVFQALQMDRRLGPTTNFKVPAASYVIFTMISLTMWIPLYDRILVPLLRKVTKNESGITILQKIGFGLFLGILTMLIAAVVETARRRRTVAHVGPTDPRGVVISSLSGNWLIPQLVLAGLSEAFAVIGQVELFYKEFPENMRSFAGSCLFCGFAIAGYLSSFLISVVHSTTGKSGTENWLAEDLNKGRLDKFYYLVAGIQVLNLGYFLVCAKWYEYKATGGNVKLDSSKPIV